MRRLVLGLTLLAASSAHGAEEAGEPRRFYGRLGAGAGLFVMNGAPDTATGLRPVLQGAAGTRTLSELVLALRSEFALAPSLSGPLVRGGSNSTVSFSTEALADWYPDHDGSWHATLSVGYQAYFSGFGDGEFPLGPTGAIGAGYDFFVIGYFAVGAVVEVRGVVLPRGGDETRYGTSPVLLITFTDR